jgi:glycosyltransferase involved in cell wall biosynthesis
LRARLQVPADAPIVGSMFRFYDEKRPLLWVEIASEVSRRRPDVHFVVFGEGPLQHAAVALADRLGIGDRFHAPGKIEDASLGLSLFDVFVLASQFEGTPNVVLEASGLGIPVVATDAGGTAEAIEQGVTGYVVTSAAPADIATRVLEILGNPGWTGQARSEGPAFVERRFGMARMIAETLALYDKKHG